MMTSSTNSLDLSAGWRICQEPGTATDGWAAAPQFDDTQWQTISGLKHLQLEICSGDERWWGSSLRAINSSAWWYRTEFDLPKDPAASAIDLDFEAVDYYTEVWLNGKLLGQHEGNFAPFTFPIEGVCKKEGNVLSVRVRAPFGAPVETWVVRDCAKGLYEHADGLIPADVNPIGIWRPVSLKLHSGIRAGRPFADTLELSEGRAAVRFRCPISSRTATEATCRVVISGETFEGEAIRDEFSISLAAGKSEISRDYKIADPQLWTVWQRGRPHLYKAEVEVLVDGEVVESVSGAFGIRTVELQRSPYEFKFLLNGEPLFIKGSSYLPDCYLSDVTEQTYKYDISLAKKAHCNLLRSHVHIARPEFYDLCDRNGMLVMQDFELNWLHPDTEEWEQRVMPVFRDMIEMLRPHPSIAFWMCFNEPVPHSSSLYTGHPAPALYEEAVKMDPTRPVFQGSGQAEEDWEKSGDSHNYFGSLMSSDYWMFLEHKETFNTEYGCTAPGARETLKAHPGLSKAVANVFKHIPEIWDYQYRLTKFATENFRRQKYSPCAGCVQFMLVDMFPQIGLGVLDYNRLPKNGYYGLAEGFAPMLVSLEHRETARAIWVVNDLQEAFSGCEVSWSVLTPTSDLITSGSKRLDIPADSSVRVIGFAKDEWPMEAGQDCTVLLALTQVGGAVLANNRYVNPFRFPERPNGYPLLFNKEFGTKMYGYED